MKQNTLIAYYSRRGFNYSAGRIVDLPVGNTEVVAKRIHEHTGGALFQIRTVKDYPADYNEATEVSREELQARARPELAEDVEDIGAFDVIFLGYPNWWGTMPMAVCTFLESHDFSGTIIVPFCTHEGSGLGSREHDIKALCPHAVVRPGFALRGSRVHRSGDEIASWLAREMHEMNHRSTTQG
jgi:flavodoxin